MKSISLSCALALAGLSGPAVQAADFPGKLTLTLKVNGSGHEQRGRDHSAWTSNEEYTLAATLITSGDPEDFNRLDLGTNSAREQKQLSEAQARTPAAAKQQQLAEQGRLEFEKCRGDLACMQQVATKMATATASWSVRPADTSADAGRFLTFANPPPSQCQGDFHARIKRRTEGAYADVQGMVPFTETATVDYQASAEERAAVCTQIGMLVLDTRANRIFTPVFMPEVKGRVVRTEGQRPGSDRAMTQVLFQPDAIAWMHDKLRNAPRSGRERTTLKLPAESGKVGEKNVTVELSWQFDYRKP